MHLKSFKLLIDALILTEASGALVPIETKVKPIINEGIFKALAILLDPSTNKSAPFINRAMPTINNKISINIYIPFPKIKRPLPKTIVFR